MNSNDFWTSIVLAVAMFLVSLPVILQPWEGIANNHGPFKLLLILGPLAMIVLAWLGRRRASAE